MNNRGRPETFQGGLFSYKLNRLANSIYSLPRIKFPTFAATMGASEVILIFLVYLLFFGAKGIPSLARNMGRAIRYFKDATSDIQRDIMDSANDVKRNTQNIRKEIERPMQAPTESKQQENDTKPAASSENKPAEKEAPNNKQEGN